MDKKSFVEQRNSPFSSRVLEAAHKGELHTSAPLLDSLEKIHTITRGFEQIFKIAHTNGAQWDAWEQRDESDVAMQPPMAPSTVEALLVLGETVSGMLISEINSIAAWAEKHGIRDPATADLMVAARASVRRTRTSNVDSTEPQHA